MDAPYASYWGKADSEVAARSGVPWHLAAFHMLDVAAVAERRIVRSDVLRDRLATLLAMPLDRVASTVAAWVALHDVGKLDVRFQLKAREAAVALAAERATCRFRGSYDHGGWGYQQLRSELGEDVRAMFGQGIDPILQAVTGHHGALPSRARRRTDEDVDAFEDPDRSARAAFVRDVATLLQPERCDDEVSGAVVAMVAGLCAVADWIGSQVDFFPYECADVQLDLYLERTRRQADTALDALRLDAAPSGRGFVELFPGKRPIGVQELTEAVSIGPAPCLVVVEATMGAGKTEAAISLAERLIVARAASGLYFALPTMATSNGLFARVVDVVPRMFAGDVNLLLAHSRARRNDAMRRLVETRTTPHRARYGGAAGDPQNAKSGFDEEASAACAKWYLASKRALASQVGVGTVDQAMMAALRVRHHFVRLYGLATSVVVLDEIHAYDAYMSVVLERLVEWLGALRTPVILLSATLPAERRRAFERAYARGAFKISAAIAPTTGGDPEQPEHAAVDEAYPLVSVVDRSGRTPRRLSAPPEDYALAVEVTESHDPIRDVLPRLVDASARGRVAWIRNTVSEAQRAWSAARDAGCAATLFHARMRARDRACVEAAVLRGFGRGGDRDAGLVIASQVIEQSLDLDFDLLVSDLAPIDLLLQRAGRLHRHLDTRVRPAGFDRRLIVVAPPCVDVAALRFGPSRYIYDPVTLWIAHDLLAGGRTIAVPACLRELVEATYDPGRRAERIGGAANAAVLAEAEATRREKRASSEVHATACAIHPTDFDPAHVRVADDDEDDETLQALTREGSSVRLLPVLWDDASDTAATLDGAPLVLDADAQGAWREAETLQDEQISVPTYRVRDEATARGDAAAYEAWRRRAHDFAKTMQLGRVKLVPMRERDGLFSGRAINVKGESVALRYSRERGLWFP